MRARARAAMIERSAILGVLLAGGLSRRMEGREKSLLALAGKPLVGHAVDRLAPQVDEAVLNANGDPARFALLGLPVIADTIAGFAGPLAGILAGMQWAREMRPHITHLASVAADTPFFPADLVARLAAAAPAPDAIVLARSAGNRHPVFGLWPVALAGPLQKFMDSGANPKIMAFVQTTGHAFADFPVAGDTPADDPFFNVNTPQDFALAEQHAGGKDDAA